MKRRKEKKNLFRKIKESLLWTRFSFLDFPRNFSRSKMTFRPRLKLAKAFEFNQNLLPFASIMNTVGKATRRFWDWPEDIHEVISTRSNSTHLKFLFFMMMIMESFLLRQQRYKEKQIFLKVPKNVTRI